MATSSELHPPVRVDKLKIRPFASEWKNDWFVMTHKSKSPATFVVRAFNYHLTHKSKSPATFVVRAFNYHFEKVRG